MFDLKSIRTKEDNSPKYYVLEDEGLKAAIQMAIWLEKPLLITGAPGTGKTQLAYKVAEVLASGKNVNAEFAHRFLHQPFVFHTKTTSTATDLFYYYDAVRHFQKRYVDEEVRVEFTRSVTKKLQASEKENAEVVTNEIKSVQPLSTAHSFIKLEALGKAIVQAWGKNAILANKNLSDLQNLAGFDEFESEPCSSVVLIDEIDKAPRDFPNDLLYEIENMSFSISELMNKHVHKPITAKVLVIMTSNFEKNLPDAFLRRCLFYHIPFPGTSDLIKIVSSRIQPHLAELYKNDADRLNNVSQHLRKNIEEIIKKFEEIRNSIKEKQPATAELLEWVKALDQQGFFYGEINFDKLEPKQKETLRLSLPILAKSIDDLEMLRKKYQ